MLALLIRKKRQVKHLIGLARCYQENRQFNEAKRQLERALRISPGNHSLKALMCRIDVLSKL